MATVNFKYRSTKKVAPLTLRLYFRYKEKDVVVDGRIKEKVTREYWEKKHPKPGKNEDVTIRNFRTDLNTELVNLQNHVLGKFEDTTPDVVNKDWLKGILEQYYNPPQTIEDDIPTDLIEYIEFYLSRRGNEISEANRKKVNVTKNKMKRLQRSIGKPILIHEINENFKQSFVKFCNKHSYSQNTQHRELVLIKTICKHARYFGVKTHPQLDDLTLKREESNHVYLSIEELDVIRETDLPHEYLDNARDWLIISCFTGQRVSDFMRFNSEMIRIEDGKALLEFRQQKTQKEMAIPVLKEVQEVLDKRNGYFPRPISDQRYNDYIKVVCRLAGITEATKGKRRVSIAPKGKTPTKNDYRDVAGVFEKWELVSSHIGRRSFATNYYGKVPTTFLINITGHGSEKMFLNYIKKSNKDLALSAFDYFN